MGNRLTKICTRTGDDGTTGLGDGSRTDKDDPRIEAIGAIDELNSTLGLLLSHELPQRIQECLMPIQHSLFDIGGELCLPGQSARRTFGTGQIEALEVELEKLNADLPPLREFILPGGCPAAAVCHFARTVCRRAERRLVSLARSADLNPAAVKYLNRLSDLLFVMARHLNRLAGRTDVYWQHERKK
jgi:cob(I)alamin adenosyltransferase